MSSPVAGFSVVKTFEGQSNWDQTYKDVQIKKKLVPLGPADENGEIPYTEELVEIVTETPIKEVIAAQEDSCGLESYLRPYKLQGTLPPEVEVTKDVQDFTIFDNCGDLRCSGRAEEIYNSLPSDLREKYGSPEKLLRDITDSVIEEYISSKIKKPEEKKEDLKDE